MVVDGRLLEEYRTRCRVWSDIIDHLPRLHAEAARRPGCRVLELGVRSGNSTAAFLPAAQAVGGHVTSVDTQPPLVPGWWWEHAGPGGCWTFLQGDDLSDHIRAATSAHLDILFIDTSHAYDHTLAELRAYVPRLQPGGVALLHDTELEAPELVGPQPPFPVARALDTYCAEAGLAWEPVRGCYGLGVLPIPTEEPS